MKKRKVLLAFLLFVCTLTSAVINVSVSAEEENNVYATTSSTVRQGSYAYAYVYVENIADIASMNVSIYYDSEKITVVETYNQISCSLYDSSNNAGCLQYSYIFNEDTEGTNCRLFYFRYRVNDNADIGSTYFDIVVTDAYNSSLESVSLSGSRCSFKIEEKATSQKQCSIYSTSNISTSVEQEFEINYRLSTSAIVSGSFYIQYDQELFEVVSVTNGAILNDKVVDVNTDMAGAVYVSFVGTEYNGGVQLVKIRFRTIKNTTESSKIKLVATEFYDKDLNNVSCSGYTTTANISFDSTYTEDAPSMTLTSVYSAENNKLTLTIKLAEDSHLGAGDFVLNFNTNYFTYNSSTKEFNPDFFNVNDKLVSEGVLKFSIISLSDIMSEEKILTIIFDTTPRCEDFTEIFDLSGNNVSDSMTESIILNYVDASVTILGIGHDMSSATCTEASKCKRTGCTHTEGSALGHNYGSVVTAPTCTAGGYTTHTCSRCADSYTDTETTKLGHDMSSATCTEASKCKRTGCNHTEGSALGHNYGSVVTAPTCTAGGYTTHTCSRCNNSYTDTETTKFGHDMSSATCTEASKCKRTGCTHTEGSALGHNYNSVVTAPTCTAGGYTTHTCSRCNNSYTNDETLELGHSWNAGVVEKEPTIYEVGKKLFTCTVCSATKTEDIPELTAVVGDVDGNAEVTSSDAVYLLMHTFYPADYPVEQESDFNGDGSVNSSDAIYLLMYTFYPEDYPLMQSSQTPAILTNRKKED